uniref:Uncharacterized protein n=1 Tax=Anguilla anguilla TaxID=7936 RepID=A0A0E9USY5_ANGAN
MATRAEMMPLGILYGFNVEQAKPQTCENWIWLVFILTPIRF